VAAFATRVLAQGASLVVAEFRDRSGSMRSQVEIESITSFHLRSNAHMCGPELTRR
jgi:hypothetical protein